MAQCFRLPYLKRNCKLDNVYILLISEALKIIKAKLAQCGLPHFHFIENTASHKQAINMHLKVGMLSLLKSLIGITSRRKLLEHNVFRCFLTEYFSRELQTAFPYMYSTNKAQAALSSFVNSSFVPSLPSTINPVYF